MVEADAEAVVERAVGECERRRVADREGEVVTREGAPAVAT